MRRTWSKTPTCHQSRTAAAFVRKTNTTQKPDLVITPCCSTAFTRSLTASAKIQKVFFFFQKIIHFTLLFPSPLLPYCPYVSSTNPSKLLLEDGINLFPMLNGTSLLPQNVLTVCF